MSLYIVLSANAGRNMLSRGPIQLMDIDGDVVIDHQIKTIKSVDKRADILFVLGFKCEKIVKHLLKRNHEVRFIINDKFRDTSACDSLKMGMNASSRQDLYIIHGDTIFNPESLHKGLDFSFVVADNEKDRTKVGLSHLSGKLLNMGFGLETKFGGITHFNIEWFDHVKNAVNDLKPGKLSFELINQLNKDIDFQVMCGDHIRLLEITKKYESSSDNNKE